MDTAYRINDFEGPLDLLLHLIKENKMDILDIEIMTLINQYLKYVDDAKSINLEVAADFLVMATTLLEIKSKVLLPKPEIEIDDDYEQNTQEQLVKRLLEYKKYKELSDILKGYNEERCLIYTKNVEDLSMYKDEEKQVELPDNIELYDLIKSMDKLQQRMKLKKPLNSVLENNEISVEQRSSEIYTFIQNSHKDCFLISDLINYCTKQYLIVTFLALLDLAKRNLIKIRQTKNFDDILIYEVK